MTILISDNGTADARYISTMNINGSMVIGRRNGTIFVRLPQELQRTIDGGCACDYCKAEKETNPDFAPKWDTLAIAEQAPVHSNDYAWTVHMPKAVRI